MNTIALQSIVFIMIRGVFMFIGNDGNRDPLRSVFFGKDSTAFHSIQLFVDRPFFALVVGNPIRGHKHEHEHETCFIESRAFISSLTNGAFADLRIIDVLAVTPPRVNRSEHWSMDSMSRLFQLSLNDDDLFPAYKFDLRNGTSIVDSSRELLQDVVWHEIPLYRGRQSRPPQ